MLPEGIDNEFEHAHQKGLSRGFDLGWSYKGRFDRQLVRDMIEKHKTNKSNRVTRALEQLLQIMKEHENNREFIT